MTRQHVLYCEPPNTLPLGGKQHGRVWGGGGATYLGIPIMSEPVTEKNEGKNGGTVFGAGIGFFTVFVIKNFSPLDVIILYFRWIILRRSLNGRRATLCLSTKNWRPTTMNWIK